MAEKKSIEKKRNWGAIIYPESAPENWRELLQKTGLPCALSPLHDRDVNEVDEEVKKAHYHVILCYAGPVTQNNVQRVTSMLNAPMPIPLDSIKGAYRYFTHKDNPDKFQYDEADIEFFSGFDVRDFIELAKSEIYALKCAIEEYVNEHSITEYSVLLDRLRVERLRDMHEVAQNNTIYCNAYISSKRGIFERANREMREKLYAEKVAEREELIAEIDEA